MIMIDIHSRPLSFLVVLILFLLGRGSASDSPIKISETIVSDKWNTTKTGQSSIVVAYLLDSSTLGHSMDGSDFYVLQSLQDGTNCENDYTDGYTSLIGMTEPDITGTSQTTTTLVSLADWPQGISRVCLRLKLVLQMSDNHDVVWHQMDFSFDVDVDYEDGKSNVVLGGGDGTTNNGGGGGIVGSLPTPDQAAQVVLLDDGPTYPGIDPTFDIFFLEPGPFPYGTEIPILIEFHHPLDIFTYNVPIENVLPMDTTSNTQLKDASGNLIALRSVNFVMLSTDHAAGIKGLLTITIPLIMFQMPLLSNLGLMIPVEWTIKSRRRRTKNLRRRELEPILTECSSSNNNKTNHTDTNNDDDSGDLESSQNRWKKDAVIQLELLPYDQESAAGNHHSLHCWILNVLVMGVSLLWDP